MSINQNLIAKQTITIRAPIKTVWDALVNPEAIKAYLFGTQVKSDWKEGSAIAWSGEWEGKSYEDKGAIVKLAPPTLLSYTHYSPLSGQPDKPENYHKVTVELEEFADGVKTTISQDNNPSEESRAHSEKNWAMVLSGMKKYVEEGHK